MIEIKNVSKSYEGEKYAVKNLSLTVNSGEIFGFLGPNGAGKTTTIKMINGINSIDSGTIYINNKNIKKESVEAKKLFTYVPDSPDMFLKLKAIEYLNFIGDVYKVSSSERESKIIDLTNKTAGEMAKVRNLGKKSLDEVTNKLHALGLDFKGIDE